MNSHPLRFDWATILGLIGLGGAIVILAKASGLNSCTSETIFLLLPLGAACGAMLGASAGLIFSKSREFVAVLAVAGTFGFWPATVGCLTILRL
jgi:hypothetical protein